MRRFHFRRSSWGAALALSVVAAFGVTGCSTVTGDEAAADDELQSLGARSTYVSGVGTVDFSVEVVAEPLPESDVALFLERCVGTTAANCRDSRDPPLQARFDFWKKVLCEESFAARDRGSFETLKGFVDRAMGDPAPHMGQTPYLYGEMTRTDTTLTLACRGREEGKYVVANREVAPSANFSTVNAKAHTFQFAVPKQVHYSYVDNDRRRAKIDASTEDGPSGQSRFAFAPLSEPPLLKPKYEALARRGTLRVVEPLQYHAHCFAWKDKRNRFMQWDWTTDFDDATKLLNEAREQLKAAGYKETAHRDPAPASAGEDEGGGGWLLFERALPAGEKIEWRVVGPRLDSTAAQVDAWASEADVMIVQQDYHGTTSLVASPWGDETELAGVASRYRIEILTDRDTAAASVAPGAEEISSSIPTVADWAEMHKSRTSDLRTGGDRSWLDYEDEGVPGLIEQLAQAVFASGRRPSFNEMVAKDPNLYVAR